MTKKQNIILMTTLAVMLAGCVNAPLPNPTTPQVGNFPHQSRLGIELLPLENPSKPFPVSVAVRGNASQIHVNDRVDLELLSAKEGYFNLYLFQKAGNVVALAENLPARAGVKQTFPSINAHFDLIAQHPAGVDTILLLTSDRRIDGTIYHDGRTLNRPQPIVAPRDGAIHIIKMQLKGHSLQNWNSAVLDLNILP